MLSGNGLPAFGSTTFGTSLGTKAIGLAFLALLPLAFGIESALATVGSALRHHSQAAMPPPSTRVNNNAAAPPSPTRATITATLDLWDILRAGLVLASPLLPALGAGGGPSCTLVGASTGSATEGIV